MKIQGDLKVRKLNKDFNESMIPAYSKLLSVILENYEKIKATENAGRPLISISDNSSALCQGIERETGGIFAGGAN